MLSIMDEIAPEPPEEAIKLLDDEEINYDSDYCLELDYELEAEIQEINRLEEVVERLENTLSTSTEGMDTDVKLAMDCVAILTSTSSYSTEGIIDTIAAIWKKIAELIVSVFKGAALFFRRIFGEIARTKKYVAKVKKRARLYMSMPIQNNEIDITTYAKRVSVAGKKPSNAGELIKFIDSMKEPIFSLQWSGIGNQGANIYDMLQDFNPKGEKPATRQLIRFMGNLETINKQFTDIGSKKVHASIRSRKSDKFDVSSIEIFGNQSIVTMVPRREKLRLTELHQAINHIQSLNTSDEALKESSAMINDSVRDIVQLSRELRKTGVYMESTFVETSYREGNARFTTMTYQDIIKTCNTIDDQLEELKKYEFSKILRTQRSYGDKILRAGNALDKELKRQIKDSYLTKYEADIWREVCNWAGWYAKNVSSYQPTLIRRLVSGYNASLKICELSLNNHRRPVEDV